MRQVRVRFSLINILNLFHSKGSLWPQIDFIVWERHYLGSVDGVGSLIWLGGAHYSGLRFFILLNCRRSFTLRSGMCPEALFLIF